MYFIGIDTHKHYPFTIPNPITIQIYEGHIFLLYRKIQIVIVVIPTLKIVNALFKK